jgi:hypothetical protein
MVTILGRGAAMPVEMLTYAALGERLGCSPEAARALAKRLRLPRQRANDGKALVAVDVAELNHAPMLRTVAGRSPDDHRAVATALKTRIKALEAELGRLEAAAAVHQPHDAASVAHRSWQDVPSPLLGASRRSAGGERRNEPDPCLATGARATSRRRISHAPEALYG